MSETSKQTIIDLIHYYQHHKVDAMVRSHPSFVIDDFSKLLALLEKELEV